jgi:hypothetical protein
MPSVTVNIASTTTTIYTNPATELIQMDELVICNKTAGSITISIQKIDPSGPTSYTILPTTTLAQGRAFYKQGGFLNKSWGLSVTVGGGNADVDLNYVIRTS